MRNVNTIETFGEENVNVTYDIKMQFDVVQERWLDKRQWGTLNRSHVQRLFLCSLPQWYLLIN